MRHFCRLFLSIIFLGVFAYSAKSQTACNAFLNDTVIVCPQDTGSYQLTPSVAGTYLWSTGATTQNITIRNKGTYWVRITQGGTTCTDTLTIGVWGQGNKGNYKWYFGNTGLDFSGSTPTLISGSTLNASGGSAPLSDPTGHILFYTDGNIIKNDSNSSMAGGTSIGGNTNLPQSSLIIPSQLENNLYYTFTISSTNQLQYSEVNLSQNGGGGQVTSTVPVTSPVSPELAGVYDSAGGFWVATESGNMLEAYHVTNSGVSTSPMASSSGATGQGSYLKFSDNGTKAAQIVGNDVIIYSFNKQNGSFAVTDTISNVKDPYALEFSKDGSKLYVTTGSTGHIYGYDATQGNSALTDSSRYLLTNDSTTNGFYGIQIAPNGQIYVATDKAYLSSIGSPESDSSGVNFQDNSVSLNGSTSLGLPNFVSNYFTSSSMTIEYSGGCAGTGTTNVQFLGIAPDSVRAWKWVVMPGDTILGGNSMQDVITYPYNYGIYNVTAQVYYQCENHIQHKDSTGEIVIYQKPTPNLKDTTLCTATSITLDGGTYYAGSSSVGSQPISYTWLNKTDVLLGTNETFTADTTGEYYLFVDNNGCDTLDSVKVIFINLPPTILGSTATLCVGQADTLGIPVTTNTTVNWTKSGTGAAFTPISTDTIRVTGSGQYTATIKASPTCQVTGTATVNFIPVPTVNLGADKTLCTGTKDTLDAKNAGSIFSYLWSTGSTSEKIGVTSTGVYFVKVYKGACSAADTVTITYENYPTLTLPSEATFCTRDQPSVTLNGGGSAASYLWIPTGETTSSITVTAGGIYTLQAFSAVAHCKTTDSVIVEEVCGPELFVPAAFSPNGDGKNDVFQIFGNHLSTYDMRVFDKWGELIFVAASLTDSWDGTYKGSAVEQGVYTWKAIYTGETLGGTVSKVQEGNVTVLK